MVRGSNSYSTIQFFLLKMKRCGTRKMAALAGGADDVGLMPYSIFEVEAPCTIHELTSPDVALALGAHGRRTCVLPPRA